MSDFQSRKQVRVSSNSEFLSLICKPVFIEVLMRPSSVLASHNLNFQFLQSTSIGLLFICTGVPGTGSHSLMYT